jgi:formate dehydrogenase major subunit
MQTVNLTIDSQQIEAKARQTILEAATAAGIHIPTLCHHPALEPAGSCRVCLVEISKFQPLYPACAYQVSEGLTVETRSPRVEKARRFVLDMIFSERNHYCMVCERSGNCELQDLGYLYGLDHWAYLTYREPFPVDASRDTFLMDHNRCVLCRRCVRACSELVANHTLGMRRRGAETMICADMNVPFGDSSCISCGTCLQVCPTGALIDKRSAYMDVGHGVKVERIKSTCHQCSVGCGIEIVVRGGTIVRIEGDWEADPNGGTMCKKGRFEPLTGERPRITRPLVRRNGRLEVAEWDAALAVVAQRLGSTNAEQIGLITSSQATNEALYLANWLFCQELGAKGGLLNGATAELPPAPGRLGQIGERDLILVVGADPAQDQPVVSFLVKRAVDKGTRLILVDGPDNDLAPFAQMQFELGALGEAVELAARAESPLVMYGAGVAPADVAILLKLERATFISLGPGANTRAAIAYGIQASFDGNGAEVLYVLLGEEDPEDRDNLKRGAEGAFLVVQTCYESPLAEQADVVLPSAIWYEQQGTYINLEGSVKRANRAMEPRGEAKADWEILSLLARALGREAASLPDALAALAIEALG